MPNPLTSRGICAVLAFALGATSSATPAKDQPLVDVSSSYTDQADGAERRFAGKGSLLRYGELLLVVTAGHVASGRDVTLTYSAPSNGQRIPLPYRYLMTDNARDISVIILEDSHDLPPPLATFARVDRRTPPGLAATYYQFGFFRVTRPSLATIKPESVGADANLLPIGALSYLPVPRAEAPLSLDAPWDDLLKIRDRNTSQLLHNRLKFGFANGSEEMFSYSEIVPGMSGAPLLLWHPEEIWTWHGMAVGYARFTRESYFIPALYLYKALIRAERNLRQSISAPDDVAWEVFASQLYRRGKIGAFAFSERVTASRTPSGNGTRSDGGNTNLSQSTANGTTPAPPLAGILVGPSEDRLEHVLAFALTYEDLPYIVPGSVNSLNAIVDSQDLVRRNALARFHHQALTDATKTLAKIVAHLWSLLGQSLPTTPATLEIPATIERVAPVSRYTSQSASLLISTNPERTFLHVEIRSPEFSLTVSVANVTRSGADSRSLEQPLVFSRKKRNGDECRVDLHNFLYFDLSSYSMESGGASTAEVDFANSSFRRFWPQIRIDCGRDSYVLYQ